MKELDLENDRLNSLESVEPPPTPDQLMSVGRAGTAGVGEDELVSSRVDSRDSLFGTLEIEGVGTFYVFVAQVRTHITWFLTDTDLFEYSKPQERKDKIVAVLRSHTNGKLEGYGKTHLLTRLMTTISTISYMCVNHNKHEVKFANSTSGDFTIAQTGEFIRYETGLGGRAYKKLEMVYEGFKLSVDVYRRALPVKAPQLLPVQDEKSKAAVVANLGIKTFASLCRQLGERLDWFKGKRYHMIDSNEKFRAMMLSFLRCVQKAASEHKTVLVGLDTETTGLNMLDLSPSNPVRDHVVAIPFGWEDDVAYLINTDMFYFDNVDPEEIYPLFETLFKRNPDYSFQNISLDYGNEHFEFNRMHITVSGWNVMFDEQAFLTEGCDVFFDEDGLQLFFNLDTDLVQGEAGQKIWGSYKLSNSLKMQTRRLFGIETLELEELFGKGNEDKFRYLQDPQLALLYGGADADFTRACVRRGKQMTEPVLYQQYRKYDMTTIYKMARAGWEGMPIDTEAVKAQGELVSKDLDRLKDFIYHYAWLANRETLGTTMEKVEELLGVDSPVEVEEALEKDKMFRYPFTPNNHKKLLFEMLGYPVVKRASKTGQPALDKYVLDKLMAPKREEPAEILMEDLVSLSDPSVNLVSKSDFNRDRYPLARVFKTYATLNKEYTSYYRPIMDNDLEGRMFYRITLARAATRRILSPAQTMKGSLKSLVVAPPGKIFMSFDASQIEYRHMASLAYIKSKAELRKSFPQDWEARLSKTSIAHIYNTMCREEADYHIETASFMTNVKPYEVTHKVRKKYKSVGFGIPYGLGDRSLCENIHGVVNDKTLQETRELLSDYKAKQKEVMDLLESARDSAFRPAPLSDAYKEYLGAGESHVGIVRNFVGFYRIFILENLTRQRSGRIRRQAGNCIIQGGAAELFRRMIYNFHIGCCRVGIQDKIHWLMTVHDELDATIDADIDIMLLIKVLYENCTLRYQDHIPYYIGINFGANWADAKDDANELPVIMVQRMIEAYDAGEFSIPSDGNQSQYLLQLKRHYLCDRIEDILLEIMPGLGPGHIWTDADADLIDKQFENYVVRAYLDVFSKKGATLKEKLEGWQQAREEYGFGKSFLATEFNSLADDLDLSTDAFDLSLDLLDNTPEEELQSESSGWLSEGTMFDQNASLDDILGGDDNTDFFFASDTTEDSEWVINKHATNAFDVYVSKHYTRTRVLKVQDGVYSALTNGTRFVGSEAELRREIKKHFSPGSDNIVIIGPNILRVANINCQDDELDWLDKLLCEPK